MQLLLLALPIRGVPPPHPTLFRAAPPPTLRAHDQTLNHDWKNLVKFPIATALQFQTITWTLTAIDTLARRTNANPPTPTLVGALFAFLSLRSRFFSTIQAQRPDRAKLKGKATPPDTKRPKWTPPGVAFPIIWLSITCLRAASAALVYSVVEPRALASPPLLALVAHLCVGDTWNSITNVEGRLGTSLLTVGFVLVSVLNAVYRFHEVTPLAGYILAPSAVWIAVASVLTFEIWRINEPRQPLLPKVGDGKSRPLRLPFQLFESPVILPRQVEPPAETSDVASD